jgi:hypothetical protein
LHCERGSEHRQIAAHCWHQKELECCCANCGRDSAAAQPTHGSTMSNMLHKRAKHVHICSCLTAMLLLQCKQYAQNLYISLHLCAACVDKRCMTPHLIGPPDALNPSRMLVSMIPVTASGRISPGSPIGSSTAASAAWPSCIACCVRSENHSAPSLLKPGQLARAM